MTHERDKTLLSTLSVHQYMPCFAFLLTIPWQMINHIRTIFADMFLQHFLKIIKLFLTSKTLEFSNWKSTFEFLRGQNRGRDTLTITVKLSWSICIFASDFICEIKRITFIFRIDCKTSMTVEQSFACSKRIFKNFIFEIEYKSLRNSSNPR